MSVSRWIESRCECCHGTGRAKVCNPKWARQMRLRAGMSLRQMAVHTGMHHAHISRAERGLKPINDELAIAYGDLRRLTND